MMKLILCTVLVCFTFQLPYAQEVSTLINEPGKSYESINWHPIGGIYSVDYNGGKLYKIELDGSVETILSGIAGIVGGGFGMDGTFYYSNLNTGTVVRVNNDGTTNTIASGLAQPTGLTALDEEHLLVCEYQTNKVRKVNINTGEKTAWASGGGIDGPDMVIPFNGEHLVSNFDNTKIFKVDASGEVLPFANLGEAGAMGYIVAANEGIYTTTINTKKIFRILEDGTPEWIAGSGSSSYIDGIGINASFVSPNGICASPSGDTLLVADQNSVRIITNFSTPPTSVYNNLSDVQSISISPNPIKANDTILLNFTLEKKKNISWSVFDITGKYIDGKNIGQLNKGIHHIPITIDKPLTGNYTIQLKDKKGKSQAIQLMVIQ